ncbi:MAG: EamA family transporter [Rhizonema sp. NSF051]|nr:EamA family transporter [Rhizonema sp. NSF051]
MTTLIKQGLFVATGTYRNGMLMAPLIAQVVTAELLNKQPPTENVFSPLMQRRRHENTLQQMLSVGARDLMATVREPGGFLPYNRDGIFAGLLLFGIYATSAIGIETISANRGGFIFALSVVFVTLFEVLLGKRSVRVILAAVLAFSGIGVMSWNSGEPLVGSLWLLGCAFLDSVYILVLERFMQYHQPLPLCAVGAWVPAVLGLLWAAPALPNQLEAIGTHLGGLIYLGIVASALVSYLEPQAQCWIPGNEVAIVRTLEPVFTAIFSFFLLGETFTTKGFIGAGIVLMAQIVLVSRTKVDDSSEVVHEQPPLLEATEVTEVNIPFRETSDERISVPINTHPSTSEPDTTLGN